MEGERAAREERLVRPGGRTPPEAEDRGSPAAASLSRSGGRREIDAKRGTDELIDLTQHLDERECRGLLTGRCRVLLDPGLQFHAALLEGGGSRILSRCSFIRSRRA